MKHTVLLLLIGLIGLSSCGKDDEYDAIIGYDKAMLNYIDAHGWDAIGLSDGMYYVVEQEGGSQKPILNDVITIKYKGYYTDDVIFDQSESYTQRLSQLIEGWKIGIPKFGVGGKGHLLIPPSLGYGEYPSGTRNQSILIFDVELISF